MNKMIYIWISDWNYWFATKNKIHNNLLKFLIKNKKIKLIRFICCFSSIQIL